MALNIYISTLGLSYLKNIDEVINFANDNNLQLEFSSGIPYHSKMESIYTCCGLKRIPHNYFPAPKIPFVLNLASLNDNIRNLSIELCINGLKLANSSKSPFYAAHFGFCIDPNPSELGQQLNYKSSFNKKLHLEIFINSLNEILSQTQHLEVDFLIENNVITKFNLMDGINPLLGCSSEDILYVMNKVNSPRLGLLLDTAHLKVSCNTLQLSLTNEVNKLANYVRGIHHSDNDGLIDNNLKIESDYWFLPFMDYFKKIPHVVEVKDMDLKTIESQIKILENYEL